MKYALLLLAATLAGCAAHRRAVIADEFFDCAVSAQENNRLTASERVDLLRGCRAVYDMKMISVGTGR